MTGVLKVWVAGTRQWGRKNILDSGEELLHLLVTEGMYIRLH